MTISFCKIWILFGAPWAELSALEVRVETILGWWWMGGVEWVLETVIVRQAKKLEALVVQFTGSNNVR